MDPTLAAALSMIASEQVKRTEATIEVCHQLLDYVVTYPNAILWFLTSEMIMVAHTDASCLSEKNAKSRAADHFHLTTKDYMEFSNGAILTLSPIIKYVVALASEAELVALFCTVREAVPLRIILEELGHPQPPTPLTMDNNTVHGLSIGKMVYKRSKAVDIHFHWLKCREAQH
eukprot:2802628-Ditylum_brightwellii.AAC.1